MQALRLSLYVMYIFQVSLELTIHLPHRQVIESCVYKASTTTINPRKFFLKFRVARVSFSKCLSQTCRFV